MHKTIKTIIAVSGYSADARIAPLMFSLYDREKSFINEEDAILSLAEDLYYFYLLMKKYHYSNNFEQFIIALHASRCDDLCLYDIDKVTLPSGEKRSQLWWPFWLDISIKNIEKGEYILIQENAEMILSAALCKKYNMCL